MKSFLRNVVNRKDGSGGALVGRTVKVGPYTVRVEAHLADGGFASIYRVRDGGTGQAFAMKHMRLMGDHEAIADCMTEVNTLKKLRDNPCILTLRAAAFTGAKGDEQEAFLLMDLCQESLVDFMRGQENKLPTAGILQIFSAVCQAVAAMHQQSPPLIHRDLKAENVLRHANGDWVLCDFGSVTDKPVVYNSSDAIMMGEEVLRKYTTPAYRAPEMWDLYARERIDTKADIWALGCLLYFLMFGKLAFQAEAKLQILKGEVSLPPTRPPPMVALLRELLVVEPSRRPDIRSVLRRLQEVAAALDVDPTLLVPRTAASTLSGAAGQAREQAPAVAAPVRQASVMSQQQPAAAVSRQPSQKASSRKSLGLEQETQPAAAPAPTQSAAPGQMAPQPAQTLSSRSASLPKAPVPPLSSTSLPGTDQEGSKAEPLAVASARRASEDDRARQAQSTDWASGTWSREGPAAASLESGRSAAAEVLVLRKQLAELQLQNQQLLATQRSQQATIKQLQVDNYNQVVQLRRIGLEPAPSVTAAPPAAAATEAGWANFDSPPPEPSSRAPLSHIRTPVDASFASSFSPRKGSLNGTAQRPLSPIPSLTYDDDFNPFGIEPREAAAAGTPQADPGSGNATPSDTLSRHSALSAFAESLKQPALAGDGDGDVSSPLSAGAAQEPVQRSHSVHKTLRKYHRRSSSEPVALENMSLVE